MERAYISRKPLRNAVAKAIENGFHVHPIPPQIGATRRGRYYYAHYAAIIASQYGVKVRTRTHVLRGVHTLLIALRVPDAAGVEKAGREKFNAGPQYLPARSKSSAGHALSRELGIRQTPRDSGDATARESHGPSSRPSADSSCSSPARTAGSLREGRLPAVSKEKR